MFLTVNVFVIEDNLPYKKKLIQAIENYSSEFIQFTISPIGNHLFFMKELETLTISDTDLFIFDIDLKTTYSGIDLAEKVRQLNTRCPIIFLTSIEDKAISIINSDIFPIGYVVKKTIDSEKMTQTIQRLLDKVEQRLMEFWRMDPDVLILNNGAEKIYINCKEMLYIESLTGMQGRILIKTLSEDIIIDSRIGKIKSNLHQPYLFTTLQSYVINLLAVSSLDRSNGIITFSDGQELPAGVKIIDKIKKKLLEFVR